MCNHYAKCRYPIQLKTKKVAQLTDEKLMTRVKNGNLDSLSPLFEKYHVKLFNFFLRLTRNKAVSQDLTQNVFRRIISYRASYDPQQRFRTWMYQIARNVHIDHVNQNNLLISDYAEPAQFAFEQTSALEDMDQTNRKKALYEALSMLSHEQREILELSKFQGLKYKEIAHITGNSVTAIKVKVHRAINKLREHYFETV